MAQPWIFSQLPTELLQQVLEDAACNKDTALNLSLVSSWVRRWADPYLYHTVVLSTSRSLRSFKQALMNKPHSFPLTYVKHLGIFALGPVETIHDVLHLCKGVNSLACGFSLPSFKQTHGIETLHESLKNAKEQHLLGISCRDGWEPCLIGSTITHLRVHLCSSPDNVQPLGQVDKDEVSWERLSKLPRLTHLAVVYRPTLALDIDVIFGKLQSLLEPMDQEELGDHRGSGRIGHSSMELEPTIQLVLVQVSGMPSAQARTIKSLNDAALKAGSHSLRIVAEPAPSSAVVQWETAVRAGKSVWKDAEEVVRERKQRLVQAAVPMSLQKVGN
ncbi:hypothetical protein ABKN59_008837 [Abortiporus biennis]